MVFPFSHFQKFLVFRFFKKPSNTERQGNHNHSVVYTGLRPSTWGYDSPRSNETGISEGKMIQ